MSQPDLVSTEPDNSTISTVPFECVVNLSEGKDLALIAELAETAREAGVLVANVTSDTDHHRSVLTWFGGCREIWRACSAVLGRFARTRSLAEHTGAHPRLGLLDVVPIVPLDSFPANSAKQSSLPLTSSTMTAAVQCARSGAQQLAKDHHLPAFLYEYAATGASRTNLADHRRALLGSPSQLWPPDYGPLTPHPRLGAVMVAARRPLVAFNLDLETTDAKLARHIAKSIRATTSGGLRGVKALGLELQHRGCAQVSVNLVDPEATSLPTLVHRVAAEARALGTRVRSTEVIGLLTRPAVDGATAEDLSLTELSDRMFVETYLAKLG